MNDDLPAAAPPAPVDPQPTSHAPAAPRRLWPGYLLIAAYWAVRTAIGRLELPITTSFMGLAGVGVLVTLLFVIWWLTNRSVAGRDRLMVFAAVVLGGAAAIAASQNTLGPVGVIFIGLPWVLTVWIVWMAIVRRAPAPVFRWGTMAAVCLPWVYVSLVKMNGVSGDVKFQTQWRWTPTAEDTYLAARAKTAADAQSADAAEQDPPARDLVAQPGDWTAFRGPLRNGEVRGLKIGVDWEKSPPKQVWRQRIGPAWSSVVIVDGRLFTQEQVGEQELVVCLDAQSGKRLWSHEDPVRYWDSQSGAGPRATPEFFAGDLYTQGGTGILNCLDAASGRAKWSRNLVKDTDAALPMWGFSSSPLVVDDVVVTFAGGKDGKGLVAYRTNDGSPAWTAGTGPISYSSAQPITVDDETLVVFLSDEGVIAVDPASGKLAWQYQALGHGVWRVVQPTALGGGSIMVGSEDLGTVCLETRKEDGQWQVRKRWTSNQLRPSFNDVVVYDGCAYGFDLGIFCCFDTQTGKRRWKGGRYGHGQVLLLTDQALLLVTAESGEAVLLEATPEKHRELARMQAIEGKTWNHPAIAHGCLYLRNDQEIACYRLPPASDEMAAR
ncbi:MAG TPA: PQQ-binding-like beta-propeller repeat protein [Pirellulales bacterium]|nr:PQQ-binding-like beta-propeller repeat protein [Pirellulales bacterium]